MPFIAEQKIDAIVEEFGVNETAYDQALVVMQGNQPILFSYLVSESFDLLTKEEKDYLLYLSLVIWKATADQKTKIPLLDSETIEDAEEQIGLLLNESKGRNFRDKLDVFFENYPQEDLLAFVEDALVDDEDDIITKEGERLLFIGLKTTIDVLCEIDLTAKK